MNTLSVAQLLAILRARWGTVFVVLACAVALAIVASLLLPRQYTATAAVVVDLRSPDQLAPMATSNPHVLSYMSTQVYVLQSERVARAAIAALALADSPELRTQWQEATEGIGDFDAWLATELHKKLDVQIPRESNVMTIAYSSQDRDFAAAIANAFMQAYIDTTLELRVEPAQQYNRYFDERAAQLRVTLEQAQQRLSAYQQDKGLIATDERIDVENLRLTELSSQLVALQAVVAESSGRSAQLGANADRMAEVLQSPILPELVAELSRQEARLSQLRERLGERHPDVIGQTASIAQVRRKIDAEVQRASGSVRVVGSVNQTRLAQLSAALAEQREKVLQLRGQRDEASILLRDVENAERAYQEILARVTQTTLESQNTQTNVSVLKRATPPPAPSSPRPMLNLAVALVLGGALALGLALLRELLDRRVRTPEDVQVQLRQPLLVTMPGPDRGSWGGRTRIGRIKARVISGTPRIAG